jgi:hypothetical protein
MNELVEMLDQSLLSREMKRRCHGVPPGGWRLEAGGDSHFPTILRFSSTIKEALIVSFLFSAD